METSDSMNQELEAKIAESEEKHRQRRRSSGRIYGIIERLFFLAIVLFMVLAFLRFFSAVAPAFFGG